MSWPILIPNVGFDLGLNSMIAVAATGMTADFGSHVHMDLSKDTFFDDEVIEESIQDYLDHDISIVAFIDRVRDHFAERTAPWGFKFSTGLGVLPIFRHIWPSMRLLVGSLSMAQVVQNILITTCQEDSILSATVPELWADVEAKNYALERAMMTTPTLVLPYELMAHNRQQALAKLAEFLGGDYRSGNIARMVESAQRKLLTVYSEEVIGSGFSSG